MLVGWIRPTTARVSAEILNLHEPHSDVAVTEALVR